MRISLGESHTVGCDFVNRRRVQVRRAKTTGIESALIVRQNEDNIGTSNAPAKGFAAENRTAKKSCADSLQEIASGLMRFVHTVVLHFENRKVQQPL